MRPFFEKNIYLELYDGVLFRVLVRVTYEVVPSKLALKWRGLAFNRSTKTSPEGGYSSVKLVAAANYRQETNICSPFLGNCRPSVCRHLIYTTLLHEYSEYIQLTEVFRLKSQYDFNFYSM